MIGANSPRLRRDSGQDHLVSRRFDSRVILVSLDIGVLSRVATTARGAIMMAS
jgi:hypothetical protein